jgi:hypothetical protein
MGLPDRPGKIAPEEVSSDAEEEEETVEAAIGHGGGSGSGDPMTAAVLQLTKLVTEMEKKKLQNETRNWKPTQACFKSCWFLSGSSSRKRGTEKAS